VRAIDLRSCHPRIEQADFFDLEPAGDFDAVVCSMVINCVTTPEARGDMLLRLLRHARPGGHVFLTLPLRCLTHSPATSWASFLSVLRVGSL
jgi:25S rRNA (adenine2142-N1)-methyltransferase